MRVLITRPSEDAARTATALAARGIETAFDPMLEIVPIAGASVDLAGIQAICVTSANGARALVAATERRDVPIFTVGEASAKAARKAGFRRIESGKGDSDALARLVLERLDARDGAILYVSGSAIVGDLADRLTAAGFTVRRAILYDAVAAKSLAPATIRLLREQKIDIALFFSPRSAETFVSLARRGSVVEACGQAVAICLSPAVADAARAIEWKAIRTAQRPESGSLIATIDVVSREREPGVNVTSKDQENAKPASATTSSSRPKRRRVPAALWLIALLVVVAAGGWATWPQWREPALARIGLEPGRAGDRALAERAAALESESRAAALRAQQEIGQLARRLSEAERALEAARAQGAAPTVETARALKTLEERIAALESRVAVPPRIVEAPAAAAADPRVDSLAASLREATQRLARIETGQAEVQRGTNLGADSSALMLAAAQLGNALASPGPFATEIAVLRTLGANDPKIAEAIALLASHAERGIATRDALARRFESVAAELARSEIVSADGDLFGRAIARIAAIISIRRTGDVPGATPGAVAARTESRLMQGDLAGAVTTLSALTGRPAEIAGPWLAEARARLLADQALAQLTARTLERAGGG